MDREHHNARFDVLLRQLAEGAARLGQALQAENTALRGGNPESILCSVQEKQRHLESIQRSAEQSERLLRDAGYPTGKEGMKRYLAQYDADRTLTRLWQRCLVLLTQCQTSNLENGAIARAGRCYIQHALAVLRGQPVVGDVYQASGELAVDGLTRPLAKV